MKTRVVWLSALFVSSLTLMCSSERSFRSSGSGGLGGNSGNHAAGDGGQDNGVGGSGGTGDVIAGGAGGAVGSGSDAGASGSGASAGSGTSEAGAGGVSSAAGAAGAAGAPDASRGGSGGASSSGGATVTASGGSGVGGQAKGGTTGSGGSLPSCGSGNRCVKRAPTGFSGPMLVSANAVSACPAAYPTKQPNVYGGLVAGSASCACNCGAPTTTCGGTGSIAFHQTDGCNSAQAGTVLTTEQCMAESRSVSMSYVSQVNATCGAAAVQKSAATPQWTQSLEACGGAVAQGTCTASDELCVAQPTSPFAAKYCVASTTETSCPSGYPVKSTLFLGYADTRACPSSCTCAASGQACELQIEVYTGSDCSGTLSRRTAVSGAAAVCAISNTTTHHSYRAVRAVSAAGACNPTAALSASGSVTESGPVTVCCSE